MEQAGPPSILINSKKAYQNIIKKGTTKGPGVPVIGFFEDENDARLVKFADAANHIREEFQFYHVYGNIIEGTKAGTVRILIAILLLLSFGCLGALPPCAPCRVHNAEFL